MYLDVNLIYSKSLCCKLKYLSWYTNIVCMHKIAGNAMSGCHMHHIKNEKYVNIIIRSDPTKLKHNQFLYKNCLQIRIVIALD